MIKKITAAITTKVMTAANAAKMMTGTVSRDDVAMFVRDEVTGLVRNTIFRYAIWMNLAFGFGGFIIGCIVMAIAL